MKMISKVALLTVTLAAGMHAHHSGAGFSKDVKEISGTVKEFQFTNPHSWIQVNVADATGKMVEWSVEWGSPNQLGRDGYRPSTFPPGAKVAIKLHPYGPMGRRWVDLWRRRWPMARRSGSGTASSALLKISRLVLRGARWIHVPRQQERLCVFCADSVHRSVTQAC